MLESVKENAISGSNLTSDSVPKTPEEINEEKRKILEQVEYYFGDLNFPKDRFLNELCGKDPSGNGCKIILNDCFHSSIIIDTKIILTTSIVINRGPYFHNS